MEHSEVAAAPARNLYHLVTDVTRAPHRLPEVRSAAWERGGHVGFEHRTTSRSLEEVAR